MALIAFIIEQNSKATPIVYYNHYPREKKKHPSACMLRKTEKPLTCKVPRLENQPINVVHGSCSIRSCRGLSLAFSTYMYMAHTMLLLLLVVVNNNINIASTESWANPNRQGSGPDHYLPPSSVCAHSNNHNVTQ